MSGCQEGILIDFSEPVEESPVSLTESIEFMRDASSDILDDLPKFETPLKTVDNLLNISSNSSSPHQPSPLRLIEDEIFDFDLPVTPGTSTDNSTPEDEEEEVFFGPVGYRERCVSSVVDSASKEAKPLSPLKPHEIAEICKEANAVACMISSAASGKKNNKVGKENILCVKQLKLGQKFDNALLGILGKSGKPFVGENISSSKDSCDSKLNIETVICDDSMKSLESFLKNEVVLQEPESKTTSASSGSDSSDSSAKKRNRSRTFTKDTTPIHELPANKRRSLPVVEPPKQTSTSAKKAADGKDGNRKSLSKLQQPKQQPPASRLTRTSIPGMNHQIQAPIVKQEPATSSEPAIKPQLKSRLSASKAGSNTTTSILPTKTKPLTSKLPTSSSVPTKSQLPQKSALPGPKGRGAPMSKLQLMKGSNSQRLSGLQAKNNNNSAQKSGPMKAFAPATKQESNKAMSEVTPAKSESIISKSSFTGFVTPTRNGSVSSVDSPVSSVNKRRSFLPTPNRLGSTGSCPSPCGSRASSTSSIESPMIGKRRPSTSARSGPQLPFELIDDSSPSALKQRRPLVTNTPSQPKKLSPWSPVQKTKTYDPFDQAFACTKIQRS